MAHLRYWFLAVASACVLLSQWLLPPEGWRNDRFLFLRTQADATPERLASSRMSRQITTLNSRLRQGRIAALVGEKIRSSHPQKGQIFRHIPPVYDDVSREQMQHSVDRQMAQLGRNAEEMVIGFMMVDRSYGNHKSRSQYWFPTEAYIESASKTPYCIAVIGYDSMHVTEVQDDPRRRRQDLREMENAVIPCAWHQKYGVAGPQIQTWLGDQGYYRFGMDPLGIRSNVSIREVSSRQGFWVRLLTVGPSAPETGYWPTRAAFGRFPSVFRQATPAHWSCMAGSFDACDRIAGIAPPPTPRPTSARSAAAPVQGRSVFQFYSRSSMSPNSRIFHDLEMEFGEEAFEAFWKSQKPVADAFQGAFGVSFGEWLHGWTTQGTGVVRAGPALPGGTIALSLLTLVSMMAASSYIGLKRTV